MKNARITSSTATMAIGTPTSTPVFELPLWSVGCGEGELVDVLDGVAAICVEVATKVWLVDCTEVLTLKEDEGVGSAGVDGELETEAVKVVLSDTEETPKPTVVGGPELSIVEKGYGSSEVVRLVSQQLGPPRPCPAAPAQHQLFPFDSQRLTSPKPSN